MKPLTGLDDSSTEAVWGPAGEQSAPRTSDAAVAREAVSGSPFMTLEEAAAYLRMRPRSLRRYYGSRAVTYYKRRGIILFQAKDLDAMMQRFRVNAIPARLPYSTCFGKDGSVSFPRPHSGRSRRRRRDAGAEAAGIGPLQRTCNTDNVNGGAVSAGGKA